MTWDPSRPSNDEKIRNMGQNVFRPFWDAIEQASENVSENKLRQWGINLRDRSTIGGATNDPGAIDDTGILYVKNDGPNPELFFRDTQDNFVQLTRDGNLGSSSGAVFNSISFNSSNFFIMRWAKYNAGTPFVKSGGTDEFDTNATATASTNVSVTFSTPMPGAYAVAATSVQGTVRVTSQNANGFTLNFRTPQGGNISPIDVGGVHLIVTGVA